MGAVYLTAQAVSGTDSWQEGRACGYRSSSELRMASAMPRSPGSKGRPIEGRYRTRRAGIAHPQVERRLRIQLRHSVKSTHVRRVVQPRK